MTSLLNKCPEVETTPQKLVENENRLKYWSICLDEWNQNGNLRSMNRVFEKLNYEFVNGLIGDDWDILWAIEHPLYEYHHYQQVPINLYFKEHQKVNHFPGNGVLINKSRMTVKNKDLKYILPAFRHESIDELRKYIEDHPEKKFVRKDCYNRGVRIIDADEIDPKAEDTFYQVFLDKPFLVEKRAFDMGVFVLITSVDPLRAYRFDEEILLRFCSEDYYPFDGANTAKYVVDDRHTSAYEMEIFNETYRDYKYTFKTMFEKYIEKKGFSVSNMWKQVDDAISSILLNTESSIIDSLYHHSLSSKNFFELVRFDFNFDENMNAYVMEVNMSPNITPAQKRFEQNSLIYEQLVYDTVKIIGGETYYEFMSRINNDTTILHHKNIAAYTENCVKFDCINNCNKFNCKLCHPCLSNDEMSYHVREAYRENIHADRFKRVFPTYRHYNDYDLLAKMTYNNAIMMEWYLMKCLNDEKWC